jgi:hypothetical protein
MSRVLDTGPMRGGTSAANASCMTKIMTESRQLTPGDLARVSGGSGVVTPSGKGLTQAELMAALGMKQVFDPAWGRNVWVPK